jgi:hypothetical protein
MRNARTLDLCNPKSNLNFGEGIRIEFKILGTWGCTESNLNLGFGIEQEPIIFSPSKCRLGPWLCCVWGDSRDINQNWYCWLEKIGSEWINHSNIVSKRSLNPFCFCMLHVRCGDVTNFVVLAVTYPSDLWASSKSFVTTMLCKYCKVEKAHLLFYTLSSLPESHRLCTLLCHFPRHSGAYWQYAPPDTSKFKLA